MRGCRLWGPPSRAPRGRGLWGGGASGSGACEEAPTSTGLGGFSPLLRGTTGGLADKIPSAFQRLLDWWVD